MWLENTVVYIVFGNILFIPMVL